MLTLLGRTETHLDDVPNDGTVLEPSTRLAYWVERIETTQPSDDFRTYARGAQHARLVLPIPMWLAQALVKFGVR